MKKILLFLLLVFSLIVNANSIDYFAVYNFSYSDSTPNSVYVGSGVCNTNDCSSLQENKDFFKIEGRICLDDLKTDEEILTCLNDFKITNGIASNKGVIIKQTLPTNGFGYYEAFFPSQDSYIPQYFRTESWKLPNTKYNVYYDLEPTIIYFKKVENAIAEVGQLNVINLDDKLKPVQIEVPVNIENSVCSAYEFVDPNTYRFTPPAGYSDYSSKIKLQLDITKNSDSTSLLHDEVLVDIQADECTKLSVFSWVPPTSLENESIKFKVTSDVVDNQVNLATAKTDWAEVNEVIYPINLDGSAWTRAYDFTLSNTASTQLTTSVAQIQEGETLFAIFKAGAFTGNNKIPIDYNVEIYFNDTLIYQTVSSTTSNTLTTHIKDISSNILGLAPGSYNVTLITTPICSTCTNIHSVEQTQNLEILPIPKYSGFFKVSGYNQQVVENAKVTLELITARDNFQTTPTYLQSVFTDANGIANFDNVIAGDYKYTIEAANYTSVTSMQHIASDFQYYVTLQLNNSAPVINLPGEMSGYYQNPITLDLSNYIYDFNDGVANLQITTQLQAQIGTSNLVRNGLVFKIYSTTVQDMDLKITVTDPFGATATDNMVLHFQDNAAPSIDTFTANPDNIFSGTSTTFDIALSDLENDALSCFIEFGDQTTTQGNLADVNSWQNCNSFTGGVTHQYDTLGTYTAILHVADTYNRVTAQEMIFVVDRVFASPEIGNFTLTSTNGDYLPTDLIFNFNINHPDNLSMVCEIRENSITHSIGCNDTTFTIAGFNQTGTSTFSLVVTDSAGKATTRVITKSFYNFDAPNIDYFNIQSTGNLIPTNLTLEFRVTHPNNVSFTCAINNVTIACQNQVPVSYEIINYNVTGVSNFTLEVVDINNYTATSTAQITLAEPGQVNLSTTNVKLDIANVLNAGEFKFNIITTNETLAKREIFLKPSIVCNGVENKLKGDKTLSSFAQSSVNKPNEFTFSFTSNTNDYVLNVVKNTNCLFKVNVVDKFGTDLNLEKIVRFEYIKVANKVKSISGRGLDLMNFMDSAISNNIGVGFNNVEFNIVNNEAVDKEISISVSSRQLDLNSKSNINLGAFQERKIQVPLFITENTKPGLYPVRISVTENNDKHTKYTYIKVE